MGFNKDDKADAEDKPEHAKYFRERARGFKDSKAKQRGTVSGKGAEGNKRNSDKRTG